MMQISVLPGRARTAHPPVLTLTGTVTTGPALAVNANPLLFNATDQGQITNSPFILSNRGGAVLNITALTFSNSLFSYDSSFGTCGNLPINLASQAAAVADFRRSFFSPVLLPMSI